MYIIDGYSNESTGKGKLKKRASKFINSLPKTLAFEKLSAVSYNSYQDIETIIKRAQAALIYLSDLNTISKIELVKDGKTTLPDNLPETEVINKCFFFVSMLGFLDRHISDANILMEHHSKFMDIDEYSAEAYYKAKNLYFKLLSKRENVLKNFRETNILKVERASLPQCIDFLEKVPLFKEFGELYKNTNVYDARSIELINNFINAYSTGYNASCDNLDLAVSEYTELYFGLKFHLKQKNEKFKEYIKNKK